MRTVKSESLSSRVALLAVLALAAGASTLIAPAGAIAACPAPPPGEAALSASLSEGAINLGPNATAEGVSATLACGAIKGETLNYSIPAANVTAQPFNTKLFGVVPIPTTLAVNQAPQGELFLHENFLTQKFDGYEATLSTSVTLTLNYFGFARCSLGPFPLTLTTEVGEKPPFGHFFEGALGSLAPGKLVGKSFAVPGVQASRTCPSFLAWVTNLLLRLPLEPGQASVATTASLKLEGSSSPTFAGLKSATTCVPVQTTEGLSYSLTWEPASDPFTPTEQIVYNIYQATKPGGENFSTPTYTTPPGATSFKTPLVPEPAYFVVRARDQLGLEDSNTVEMRGTNLCV
jgi:hypothetical protein